MSKHMNIGGVLVLRLVGVPDYQAMLDSGLTTEETDSLCLKWNLYSGIIQAGSSRVSQYATAKALRLAKIEGDYDLAVAIAKWKRKGNLTHLTTAQRSWQGKCRSEARARHHDSVALREKYVRAQG